MASRHPCSDDALTSMSILRSDDDLVVVSVATRWRGRHRHFFVGERSNGRDAIYCVRFRSQQVAPFPCNARRCLI